MKAISVLSISCAVPARGHGPERAEDVCARFASLTAYDSPHLGASTASFSRIVPSL